jgi:hypothetical protein
MPAVYTLQLHLNGSISSHVPVPLFPLFPYFVKGKPAVNLTSQLVAISQTTSFFIGKIARPERFELPTLWFEARCSDPLSYGRVREIINVYAAVCK